MAEWLPLADAATMPVAGRAETLGPPPACTETAFVRVSTPDGHYLNGEEMLLQMLPATDGFFEIAIKADDPSNSSSLLVQGNTYRFKRGLPVGSYTVRVRWLPPPAADGALAWSGWSRKLEVVVHPKRDVQRVKQLRTAQQRLGMMVDRDVHGTGTITDPWAIPPACPEDEPVRWFRIPCYEGSATPVNEHADYYRDPLAYYLACIGSLKERGAVFRTWHDLLDDPVQRSDLEVVLQLDIDAGPRSMERLHAKLAAMGVKANLMIHRRCYDWYEYTVEDLDLDLLQEAERLGWVIGYHNNSIGNVQRLRRRGDYSDEVLRGAAELFRDDVAHLRRWFDVRTYTHHGGNVLNKLTPVPDDAGVVGVDRAASPSLWRTIDKSFSDGGFLARPCPLKERVEQFDRGRFFIRNHPLKYANFTPPFDVPPLVLQDSVRAGAEPTDELAARIASEIRKQQRWLDDRNEFRIGPRTSHARADKPISARFRPRAEIQPLVERFYAKRREAYVRQSPWMWGDPRVFWWRMLDAYAPRRGRLLNVGALPLDRRDETLALVGDEVQVFEMDIDPQRRPHLLCDITNPPRELYEGFDAVLLFGLTVVHRPSLAVKECWKLTRPGGVALFGFSADTHPLRGGLWSPATRPVWRREKEPLRNIELRGSLWSFDEACIEDLFAVWDDFEAEFFSDMFYLVCRKDR